MSTILDEDIIMKDYTNNNYNSSNKFYLPSSNFIRPRKRTFLDMLHNSNQTLLNYRIDNYKLCKKILSPPGMRFTISAFLTYK